jgi:TetR/AcrR family transcriptional regulator, cholesterol catabolism regulator
MRPSTAPDDQARPRAARGLRRPLRARNADANSATRIEILKSAAAAFRKLGYHGATVEQIASALRMKKGNLYYYFRNKEEILFACHQYSLDRLLALLDEVQQSGANPEEQMRRLIVSFVHTILDELHGTALFLDLEALTAAHLKTVIVRRDQFDRGMRQVIEEGVASGSFGSVDAKLLSFAILGAVNWIPRWFNPEGPASSEEIGHLFADYLIGGLRHRPR